MLHVWIIALFGAVVLHDAMPRVFGGLGGTWWIALGAPIALMAAIAVLQHIVLGAAAAGLRREGSWKSVRLAEQTLSVSRVVTVLVHVISVLVLGWLDAVRAIVGDLLMIDELIAMLPALAVLGAGWWSMYPIERHMRESAIVRDLDSGRPMYPVPTRAQWTISNIRHQLLLSLVPMAMIGVWTEGSPLVMERVFGALAGTRIGTTLGDPRVRALIEVGVQIAGALTVFALTPLVMRHVWDTVRLGAGPVRDRLLEMSVQCGVTVREVLVWRTHGSMINGAVMGLAGPVRYVLLTDALLDHLPDRQVEAVMAHELAHARHAHLPWLAGTLMAGMGGATTAGVYGISALGGLIDAEAVPVWLVLTAHIGVQIAGLVVGVLVFGYVSRRFEWQADAFAARYLSAGRMDATTPISQEGAAGMVDALDSVARLNHVPKSRGSFRHGSIGQRQRNLELLVGSAGDRMPIDRSVRWIKAGVLLTGVLVIAAVVADAVYASSRGDSEAGLREVAAGGTR